MRICPDTMFRRKKSCSTTCYIAQELQKPTVLAYLSEGNEAVIEQVDIAGESGERLLEMGGNARGRGQDDPPRFFGYAHANFSARLYADFAQTSGHADPFAKRRGLIPYAYRDCRQSQQREKHFI